MKREPVVTRENAISIVRTTIARADSPHRLEVLEDKVSDLWWAWIVPVQTIEYARTRDVEAGFLIGLGPYLVDKFTIEAIPTGSGTRLHPLERARGYRSWWNFRGPNWITKL